MKITALEEYGLRCMVLFARQGKAMSIPEIAEREGLSIPYAGKLLRLLRSSGLIDAERGRNGGYSLSRNPKEIKLSEIFEALGEPVFGTHHCDKYKSDEENHDCVHSGDCHVKDVWRGFHDVFSLMMEKVTLKDIAKSKTDRVAFLKMAGIDNSSRN